MITHFFVDEQWLKRLSLGLQRFRKVKENVYQCRCPFCGDSKRSSLKARFYFYVRGGSLMAQCHNCGYSRTFYNFVYDYAPDQFDEYKKEALLSTFHTKRRTNVVDDKKTQEKPPEHNNVTDLCYCIKCSDLKPDHVARQYLSGRHIPDSMLPYLLFTDDFKAVAQQFDEEAAAKLSHEPRIIIPFYDKTGKEIEMIQGRGVEEKAFPKYLSIKSHEDVKKIFGYNRIDWNRTTYCVEGPFDSLFVDNCMATCDAALDRSDADVLVWDNEPRNKDVVKAIKSAIDKGRKVVIWPTSPNHKQDINDMICQGVTPSMIQKVIEQCTYQGAKALIKLNQWKKVSA